MSERKFIHFVQLHRKIFFSMTFFKINFPPFSTPRSSRGAVCSRKRSVVKPGHILHCKYLRSPDFMFSFIQRLSYSRLKKKNKDPIIDSEERFTIWLRISLRLSSLLAFRCGSSMTSPSLVLRAVRNLLLATQAGIYNFLGAKAVLLL